MEKAASGRRYQVILKNGMVYLSRNASTQSVSSIGRDKTPHDVTRHDARSPFRGSRVSTRYLAYSDGICIKPLLKPGAGHIAERWTGARNARSIHVVLTFAVDGSSRPMTRVATEELLSLCIYGHDASEQTP